MLLPFMAEQDYAIMTGEAQPIMADSYGPRKIH